ncbi:hypothetical protein [Natrinema hispanicum]|uniref:DUF4145 domain-containing protein n=1 Tax=Natrinema hispanicum TaxID=392421 RepID=A0A1G6IIE5_9EURY|nr:hypothetical protein [Natrinema hispanicum]SDC05765.1 hypothetical protein SAMN05192552_1001262 [Natrinema hispanicum]
MNRYVFTGSVFPERANVNVSPPVEFSSEMHDFEISIIASQITVVLESEEEIEDIHTVRNLVKTHTQALTDIFAYTHGYAYSVEITSVVGPNNERSVFGATVPVIRDQLSEKDRSEKFNEIWELVASDVATYIDRILVDLRLAMKHAHDTGFYCYRAIETIRKYFHEEFSIPEENNEDIKQGWVKMRGELGIDRTDLDKIKVFADERRHGGEIEITNEERAEVFEVTWDVINSFFQYTKKRVE